MILILISHRAKERILTLVSMATLGCITTMLKYKLLEMFYGFTVPIQLVPLAANGHQGF